MEPLTQFQENVLSDLLQSLHLQSTLYCRAKMGAPWGFRVSPRKVASFHIVTEGTCWLTVEGIDKPVLLTEGDLVILPHGHAHTMTDEPKTPVIRLEDMVARQQAKRDGMFNNAGEFTGSEFKGKLTTLVCGGFQLEEYATNPLFSILPPFLHIRSQHGRSFRWLRAIVKVVKAEASANNLAAETIITRLSEILFIQAVRVYLATVDDGTVGWFNALKDPQIGQALVMIQRQPEGAWMVESLASGVNLSRSAFSAKFKQLVGEPPMQYITRVRLTKAAVLLRTNSTTLMEVALSIGYDSEVAFSKAFKRYYGMAPGAYRQGRRPKAGDGTLEEGYSLTGQTGASSAQLEAYPLLLQRET